MLGVHGPLFTPDYAYSSFPLLFILCIFIVGNVAEKNSYTLRFRLISLFTYSQVYLKP